MLKSSKIELISPLGEVFEIKAFSEISIEENSTDMIKRFNINANFLDHKQVEKFDIGTTVKIYHGDKGKELEHIFTGIVDKTPKSRTGKLHLYQLQGTCFLGETQNRIINEAYQDRFVHEIFKDLISRYAPYLTLGTVQESEFKIDISFSDTSLFDCLKRIQTAIDYVLEVDKDKRIHFVKSTGRNSPYTIKEGMYQKGSASFSLDKSRMVNELTVRGGVGLSNPITDVFISNGLTNIYSLRYSPSEAEIYVDDVLQTLSIENFSDTQIADVYIAYGDKAIRFTNPPAKDSVIKCIYKRKYHLKRVLNDFHSQEKWGIKSDIISFAGITNETDLIKRGNEYLKKNSNPRISGTVRPFINKWRCSENVKVEIPSLKVNDMLFITGKQTIIQPNISTYSLSFDESPLFTSSLSEILKRLGEIETKEYESVQSFYSTFDRIKTNESLTFKERKEGFKVGSSKVGEVI